MPENPSYLHPLSDEREALPRLFTFPFRYTPHPLCARAARLVTDKLREMGRGPSPTHVKEGKMYGVLVGRFEGEIRMKNEEIRDKNEETGDENGEIRDKNGEKRLYFLAAYSGQLRGSYDHPWFVPPVVDYLAPESHFQQEQKEIAGLSHRMEALRESTERRDWQQQVAQLKREKEAAVAAARQAYAEGKARRETLRATLDPEAQAALIRESQQQKADIQRAKQLHKQEIAALEARLAAHNATLHALFEERKQRSEALQQWLFRQFDFLNARGERKNLTEIFDSESRIPSGAGECCAPKLLQTAYQLGLQPLAMAEFWWGPSNPGHYHEPGAFFPACHSKCRPILAHMLQGLAVEPDPAEHYEQTMQPVRIVWEDEYLAIIYKPEGWCSIPGKSHQANLLDEAHRLWQAISGSVIAHRLDQDTSGVMVLAKNAQVHRALGQQFERRQVQKRYVALLEGQVEAANGCIDLPIGPDLEDMPHQRVDHENGKEAVTRYEVQGVEEKDGQTVTRVCFYPQTGRTHQLRVHSASPEGLNAPILGDRLYGHVADRLYLHAEALSLIHPVTHERMHFEQPAPF